jgi:hypothetical protein
MRRLIRFAITAGAAAVVISSLSGATLPTAAAISPAVHRAALVVAPYHQVVRVTSDIELAKDAAESQRRVDARRAAIAAAQAAAAAAAVAQARAAAAAPGVHTVNVWTTGFQAQINQCRGAVDMTARYGMRIVGEHWSCGGSSFPTTAGTIVRLTGLDAGTYRVIGLVATLDAYTAHTYQVPHNYQMLYQTCRGGNSHYTEFIALAKVG